jgi:hypothetical protein
VREPAPGEHFRNALAHQVLAGVFSTGEGDHFFILKTAVERQRRGLIPAWGQRSVAPGKVSLFFFFRNSPSGCPESA